MVCFLGVCFMATDKPRFSLTIPNDVLAKVEQYQAEQKISTKSKAIHRLIEIGLSESADDPHGTAHGGKTALEANYDALDAHGRRLVDLVIDAELERMAAVPVVVDFPRPMIQHFLVPAAAGYASPIEGEEYEMIPLPDDAPDDADFCITVRGDSMEPKLHDGELAYVRRGAPLDEYDVGVFYVSGDVLIKRWHVDRRGILHLTGTNPAAQGANRIIPVSSQDSVVCFGKVINAKKPPRGEA